MKYPNRFAILFSPQLLAGYDQIYILHIYSQMCPLLLCIFKERMCCSLHIPSGYFCSKAYMYQIYLLRTTGNKEWWTSSCVFYCCVSRTQSDMLRIEKTKSDHTYQEEGRMRTMVYCYVHFVTLKIILRKAYHQKEQHIKSKEKCCHPLYLSLRKKSMQKIKDVVWQEDACLLPCMYLWSLRLV